jgi:hypothetical protein
VGASPRADALDIRYRVEHQIEQYSDDVGVSQTQLDEMYTNRSQVVKTINVCKEGVSDAYPPETAHWRSHTCSYRCVCGSSL